MSVAPPLRIGICCYPTYGGSGVIATEIGLGMARRGHDVHLFAYDRPARHLDERPQLTFHRVEVRDYPVFHQPPYALALASRIVDVAQHHGLDILHVHYAVPHATSAFLAREVLGAAAPHVVTTLHGTDITLVGGDPSYRPITRFSIARSDAVTTPSQWLCEHTREALELPDCAIEVIPNFVDTQRFAPPDVRAHDRAELVHVSNFRPVKRTLDVVRAFAAVAAQRPASLTLVGDGPDRPAAEALVASLGLAGQVAFRGALQDVRPALAEATLFLMPSESESFGLAALEAQAMGVPVVASAVGGVPEVIADGDSGVLVPVGDPQAMGAAVLALLADAPRLEAMGQAARRRVLAHFEMEAILDRYEALYRRA